MADEALYMADDGEIKLFVSESERVTEAVLPDPYPGDTWTYDPRDGLPMPHLTVQERLYTRLKLAPPEFEAGLRRLIAERDEARELLALMYSAAPVWAPPDQWSIWDRVQAALRKWGLL